MLYLYFLFISLVSLQISAQEIPTEKELYEGLGEAIVESNLRRLEKAFPKMVLTQEEKRFCLDLAQEMIELRRNEMLNLKNATMFQIDNAAGWMFTGSLFVTVVFLEVCRERDELIPALISILIGMLPLTYSYHRYSNTFEKKKNEIANRYEDAVKIKQFFYEES